MVAKVSNGKNILGMLNYNEKKVKEGVASCIDENLYGREVSQLSFSAKLKGLMNFMERNKRASSKAVHISLNFHPDEKLGKDILCQIARSYMNKIGFEEQPYLVYEHHDAAHPHIHILTTNITKEGKRIVLYNIGRNQSEKARKEIEMEFNLVKAAGRKEAHDNFLRPVDLKQLDYGKGELKRQVSNIVRTVTKSYKYTSLTELNTILHHFNILADRGSERSTMHNRRGLHYRVLDIKGNKIGVPIKASSIYDKPTLAYLEKQFQLNQTLRQPHQQSLKNHVDEALSDLSSGKSTKRLNEFIDILAKAGIDVAFRQNDQGRVYGVTFVDHKSRVVFKGSDLGKPYSANAILKRLHVDDSITPLPYYHITTFTRHSSIGDESSLHHTNTLTNQLINNLLESTPTDFTSPDSATKKRRRKKLKRRGL